MKVTVDIPDPVYRTLVPELERAGKRLGPELARVTERWGERLMDAKRRGRPVELFPMSGRRKKTHYPFPVARFTPKHGAQRGDRITLHKTVDLFTAGRAELHIDGPSKTFELHPSDSPHARTVTLDVTGAIQKLHITGLAEVTGWEYTVWKVEVLDGVLRTTAVIA